MEYGLIGEKLGHSYSKIIHEKIADYTYELCPLNKDELPLFMKQKQFKAINVTIPYKKEVIPFLDHIDEKAKAIGAVNTVINQNGSLTGYNTDYYGFLYTLRKHNINVSNQKVLVIGNGGAAQAVLAVLKDEQAKSIHIIKYKKEEGTITYEEAMAYHNDAYLIVNTSPVGMYPNIERSPIDLSPYHSLYAVVDLIYNPSITQFMSQAMKQKVLAINGLLMLIAQAVYAAEHFLGRSFDRNVIDELYETLKDYHN